MSHLSILPTVLRDAAGLTASLQALGLEPRAGGVLMGFAGEQQPVVVQVVLSDGLALGWARQGDGSLALVGDLQRLSQNRQLPVLLGRITRHYAAQMALQEAASHFAGSRVTVAV